MRSFIHHYLLLAWWPRMPSDGSFGILLILLTSAGLSSSVTDINDVLPPMPVTKNFLNIMKSVAVSLSLLLEGPCWAVYQGPYLWPLPNLFLDFNRMRGGPTLCTRAFPNLINCPLCTSAGPLLPPIAVGPIQRAAMQWYIHRQAQHWKWRQHRDA